MISYDIKKLEAKVDMGNYHPSALEMAKIMNSITDHGPEDDLVNMVKRQRSDSDGENDQNPITQLTDDEVDLIQ